jgi:hypothetical protein
VTGVGLLVCRQIWIDLDRFGSCKFDLQMLKCCLCRWSCMFGKCLVLDACWTKFWDGFGMHVGQIWTDFGMHVLQQLDTFVDIFVYVFLDRFWYACLKTIGHFWYACFGMHVLKQLDTFGV